MARKTIKYLVNDEGRDKNKLFIITEMSARTAESWAVRALMALLKNNIEVPSETMSMAMMAEVGFKAIGGLEWGVAKPLLDEMLDCVKIVPDPQKPYVTRSLIDEDIEEVKTLMNLRLEVWNLHTDFFRSAVP
jgi:hypothetical protein